MTQTRYLPTYPRTQCQATLTEAVARYRLSYAAHWGKTPNVACTFAASIEIDGKCLCRRHAAEVALKMLMREE